MKNKSKILYLIVLTTVILFMAVSCSSKPSGTYSYTDVPAWTITFASDTFIMFVPASVLGQDISATGSFIVSGKTLILTGLDQPMSFTITNSKTLTESDGSVWRKQ